MVKPQDSIYSIVGSAKRFFTGTMFSRVTGLLRDMAMAATFGTQESVAAFLVAFRFAHLLRRLFGEGALQSAFIPEFEKLRHEDPQKAFSFFKYLSIILTLFLIVIIFIAMGGIGTFLTFGNLQPANQEILQLAFILMPSLLFICLFGLNTSLLQCEKIYFTPSIAPAAFNCMWIAGILYLSSLPAATAMPRLAFFVILACICQWGMTVPRTLKLLKNLHSSTSIWRSEEMAKALKAIIAPLCLGIIGVGASQINNALDSIFARYASLEGPAYLWYAIRIQQLPLALFGIALSGAILPPLSRAAKESNLSSFYSYLQFGLCQIFFLMIPITYGIFLVGTEVIHLIYGHGDFGKDSVIKTTQCLWGYGIGLVPMAATLVLAPAFYALKNYSIPTRGSILSVLINIILNAGLIFGLGLGSVSVALATSFSAWFNLVFLLWNLKKVMPNYTLGTAYLSFIKISTAATFSFFLVKLGIFTGISLSWIVQIMAFSLFFLAACRLLKINELTLLFRKYSA